ncbi:ankyrin repeat domain-containing protein 13B-like [Dorcoceras hygrometricum]|uniref:Ankyrin repeat domain-containing protein 13B-like n=1 Tax=Dorcoceras hygrometricum TaxID=472368 RepID=A0A2Z7AW73_9LAMI|nr:ankyrin repeat domain-containing protein 13B-like [Dorcoceras hygrometricum]
MAASFFFNTLQVDFEFVLAMEHMVMTSMFKSLEDRWLKGFLGASNSVYEGVVTEFFVNEKVTAGTIVSFVANRKMVITNNMFTTEFWLPTEGMIGFLDILKETVIEMRRRFSGSNVPFRAPIPAVVPTITVTILFHMARPPKNKLILAEDSDSKDIMPFKKFIQISYGDVNRASNKDKVDPGHSDQVFSIGGE